MALVVHLWANGPAPIEWIEYQLCSRFHKLPGEIGAERYENVRALLTCMDVEAEVRKRREDVNRGRPMRIQ